MTKLSIDKETALIYFQWKKYNEVGTIFVWSCNIAKHEALVCLVQNQFIYI